MSTPIRVPTGANFTESVRAAGFILNEGGTAILASDMGHSHQITYSQDAACPGAHDATEVLHVGCGTAGTVKSFSAGIVSPSTGNSTIAVDLKLNGTTMLSAAISLTSTETAYELVHGVLSTTTIAAEDVLTVVVTVTEGSGTLGTGVFAVAVIDEDYAG
jgi:hypothetical protein